MKIALELKFIQFGQEVARACKDLISIFWKRKASSNEGENDRPDCREKGQMVDLFQNILENEKESGVILKECPFLDR